MKDLIKRLSFKLNSSFDCLLDIFYIQNQGYFVLAKVNYPNLEILLGFTFVNYDTLSHLDSDFSSKIMIVH